jgi:hypothetical protein
MSGFEAALSMRGTEDVAWNSFDDLSRESKGILPAARGAGEHGKLFRPLVQKISKKRARAVRMNSCVPFRCRSSMLCLLVLVLGGHAWSQEKSEQERDEFTLTEGATREPLNVSWLYGAYVPKDVRLSPLTPHQRRKLFVRQTFVTPGIYVKSAFLASISQAEGSSYEWGGGFEGYGRRLASAYAQSSVQNVFSTVGNAALQYEPRYDRCRCSGVKPRTKHALMRAFLTYNYTEQELRPQFALYGAALGSGMLSSLWKPKGQLWSQGFKAVSTQAGLGMLFNWIGEFAPDLTRKLTRTDQRLPAAP